MTAEVPPLIGRNRAPQRVHSLGHAVPVLGSGHRRANEPAPEPVEPKTAEQLREEQKAARDAQPVRTLCALCDWSFDGTALEGRAAAKAHRDGLHRKETAKRTRRDGIGGWVDKNPEQKAAAMVEVEKRRQSARAYDERETVSEREPQDREAASLTPTPPLDLEADTSPARVMTDPPRRAGIPSGPRSETVPRLSDTAAAHAWLEEHDRRLQARRARRRAKREAA